MGVNNPFSPGSFCNFLKYFFNKKINKKKEKIRIIITMIKKKRKEKNDNIVNKNIKRDIF